MGFTDWDWSATGRRRRARTPPAVGASMTAGPEAPVTPAMGDLWWNPTTKQMMTWNGVDWLLVVTGGPTARTPEPGTHRPHPRPDPTMPAGSMVLVVDGALSHTAALDPEVVRAYRALMEDTAERWADRHGFTIARGSWSTLPPVDPHIDVPLRLEVYLTPRTDGIWGELRDALEQDQEDREAAAGRATGPGPTDPPFVVHIAPEPA